MKITLINPYLNLEHSIHRAYVPLGISYIASVLRQAGNEINFIDVNTEKNLETRLEKIADSKIVGITALTDSFYFLEQTIPKIKEINPKAKIVLGGPLTNHTHELILKNTQADVIIYGEGEKTILELADAIEKNKSLSEVRGIYYKTKDGIRFTGARERIKKLDEISFPAFDLYDLKNYYMDFNTFKPKSPELANIFPYLSLMTHRGCSYKCKFCQIPSVWPKLTLRSIENVIAEAKWQKETFGIKGLYIRDDNFGPTETRIRAICEGIKPLELSYLALLRATTLNELKDETLKLMKESGCKVIRIGIESGSSETLEATDKKVNLQEIEKAVKRGKDFGFSLYGSFLMIGHPDETEKSLNNTVNFVSKLGITVLPLYTIPLPGTPWYSYVKEKGLIKTEADEIQFLRDLRYWQERPIINMTKVPDEKLVETKEILNMYGR